MSLRGHRTLDLLKFKIAEVKELQHVRKLNLNFLLTKSI